MGLRVPCRLLERRPGEISPSSPHISPYLASPARAQTRRDLPLISPYLPISRVACSSADPARRAKRPSRSSSSLTAFASACACSEIGGRYGEMWGDLASPPPAPAAPRRRRRCRPRRCGEARAVRRRDRARRAPEDTKNGIPRRRRRRVRRRRSPRGQGSWQSLPKRSVSVAESFWREASRCSTMRAASRSSLSATRSPGERWGDVGRCGERWGDVGRCEMWGDVGRCGRAEPGEPASLLRPYPRPSLPRLRTTA